MVNRVIAAVLLGMLAGWPAPAAVFRRSASNSRSNSKITLRKRLHVNDLITDPGSVEIDWANLYSLRTSNFAMPAAIRYTPSGQHILWGRTEYSLAFDSLASSDTGDGRLTQFSQAVTLAGTAVVYDGTRLDIAIAPQATFFLRDERGARLGAVAIMRYDGGRNSAGVTASWSGATHNSSANPAGTLDVGLGYGRQLSGSRLLDKITPHFNAEWERSTGLPSAVLVFEGVEYQITKNLAFDVSAQHFATSGAAPDHQLAIGITFKMGQ